MRPLTLLALLALSACEDETPPPRTPADRRATAEGVQRDHARRMASHEAAIQEQAAAGDRADQEVRDRAIAQTAEAQRQGAYDVERKVFQRWLEVKPSQCSLQADEKLCDDPPPVSDPAAKPDLRERAIVNCAKLCVAYRERDRKKAYEDALNACVSAQAKACVFESQHAASLASRADECAKSCATKAQTLTKVREHEIAYRKCMYAVDTQPETVRKRVHDKVLYDDVMARAQSRCWAAHKCDWVAANGGVCDYGR